MYTVHCTLYIYKQSLLPAPAPVTEIQPVLDAENITLQV